MIDWAAIALASAACFGMISVVDKILLTKYIPSAITYSFLLGLFQTCFGVVTLLLVVVSGTWDDGAPLFAGFLAGVLWGVGVIILFYVLQREEVSRAIPVHQTSPVFTAVLAVIFLGERLTSLHWMAILITVTGAVLISISRHGVYQRFVIRRSFLFLLLGSAITAGAFVLSKVALEDMSVWQTFSLRAFGMGAAFLGVSIPFRRRVINELPIFLRNRSGVSLFLTMELFLAPGTILLTLWAVSLGDVSLVSALAATRPMFVFVYSLILSAGFWGVLEEPLTRETLTLKVVAIAMIVAGTGAISLL